MIAALAGGLLGVGAGALSVGSLWLVTSMTARAASGLSLPPERERTTGWDLEAQDPDIVTTGSLLRFRWKDDSVTVSSPPTPLHRPAADRHTTEIMRRGDEEGRARSATFRILFAFFLKAPLLVLVALGAQRLGTDALHWCASGVVSVYSLAVFWAAARTR